MKTKEEIIKEFHNTFKDSSLFKCWDGCEQDLINWWMRILSQQKQEIIDKIEKKDKTAVNILSGLKVVESNLVPEDTVIVSKKLNLKQNYEKRFHN